MFPGKRRLKLSRGETLVFSIDAIWNSILEGVFVSFVWSTLVVKIKKTQEYTPSILVMPKKNNRDKENIVLLPVASPLSLSLIINKKLKSHLSLVIINTQLDFAQCAQTKPN